MEHLTNPSLCCFALIPYSTYVNSENNLINDCRDLDQRIQLNAIFYIFLSLIRELKGNLPEIFLFASAGEFSD